MPLPLYDMQQTKPKKAQNGHLGLWFERFFTGYAENFSSIDKDTKSNWLKETAALGQGLGSLQYLHQKAVSLRLLAQAQNGQAKVFHCTSSFVTGLGNPHPVENGFLWHHSLGVPYLPGSAVKGLIRSFIETAVADEALRKNRLGEWFGTEDKKDIAERAGSFIFLDALPIAPCNINVEIMTPHMGNWYSNGAKAQNIAQNLPGDWHDPVPVSYLIAKNIKLQFIILPRTKEAITQLAEIWQALEHALEWLGAGAKTAIGFGQFVVDTSEEAKLVTVAQELHQQQQQIALKAQASELELKIIEFNEAFTGLPQGLPNGDIKIVELFNCIAELIPLFVQEGSEHERMQLKEAIKTLLAEKQIKPSKNKEKAFKSQLNAL
ncbi:type III-B CRISPR module RAMP protein Cmr6 [Pseudomonas sp. F1_0610]|uniref:type III-B CRISPR module RAMP protein Cmr6 n=1 Tax=Pseudomonas sp. F1_0610 TaxID=3114284 RepID=UPI0039C45EEC